MFFLEFLLFVLFVATVVYLSRSLCCRHQSSSAGFSSANASRNRPGNTSVAAAATAATATSTSSGAARDPALPPPPAAPSSAPSSAPLHVQLSQDKNVRRTHFGLVTQSGVILKTSQEEVMAEFGEDNPIKVIEPGCCSICLVDYEHGDDIRRSFHCEHVFHSQCILDWLVEQPALTTSSSSTGAANENGAVADAGGPQCPCCRCEFVTQADLDRIPEV